MTIIQFPNWQLITTFLAWLLSHLTTGLTQAVFLSVFYATGFIWSYEELFNGVNLFRKFLGLTVLCFLLYRLSSSLLTITQYPH